MGKENLIIILITIFVFCLLILIVGLVIHQMEDRFRKDCEKQNFEGMIEYWDGDINCSQIKGLKLNK